MRGDGRIYRKPGSRFWHMAYYVDGREVSESTKEDDEERAAALAPRNATECYATLVRHRLAAAGLLEPLP